MKNMLNYKYAQLSDTGKRWYIYYYAYNPASAKLERVRIYINSFKNISIKRRFAAKLIETINNKLDAGYNPFINTKTAKQYTTITKALEFVATYKNSYIRERSKTEYAQRLKFLNDWLVKNKKDKIFIFEFNEQLAIEFTNDLLLNHNLKSNTFNKYLIDYRTFFNLLIKHKYISENPFKIVSKLPETAKNKQPFTPEQAEIYKQYLLKNDYDFYITSMYCYYCAIRPGELVQLKIKDLDLTKGIIKIPSEISKNKKQRIIPIANTFLSELKKYLQNLNNNMYLVGKGFKPNENKIASTRIAEHFRKIAIKLNLPENLYFYSLKDTCADRLIESGFSAKVIRDLFGHSDISITDKYLQGINIKVDERLRNEFPEF